MLLTAKAHMLRAVSYGTSVRAIAGQAVGSLLSGSHGSEGAQLTLSSGTQQ